MSPPPTLNTDPYLLSGDIAGTHQALTFAAKNFAGRPNEPGRAAPQPWFLSLSRCLGQSDLVKSTETPVSCVAKFLLPLGAPQSKHHCANIRRLVKQPSTDFFFAPKFSKTFPTSPCFFCKLRSQSLRAARKRSSSKLVVCINNVHIRL
jgi:hypothetical protein